MNEIKGNDIAIIGFGAEGRSTLSFLRKNFPNAKITIRDAKYKDMTGVDNNESIFGDSYLENLKQHSTIIRTPQLPFDHPKLIGYKSQGGHITTATNIFFSQVKGKTIGITGTKGKSTTTALTYHILRNNLPNVLMGGNIGIPMLNLLENDKADNIYVLELSSYQLEDIRYNPQIALILEITPEHLDHHGTFEKYAKAKAQITAYQSENDILLINPDFKEPQKIATSSKARILYICDQENPKAQVYISNNQIFISKQINQHTPVINLTQLPLIGKGNQENTLSATAIAALFDISPSKIASAIMSFTSLPHRLEFVATINNITFYNDSIATTPEATINAIEAFEGKVKTLIAGGFDRGLNYQKLAKKILEFKVENLILYPDTGPIIASEIEKLNSSNKPQIIHIENMQQAVNQAFNITPPGSICILSPASASYNLFKNYEERGELFKKQITKFYTKIAQ